MEHSPLRSTGLRVVSAAVHLAWWLAWQTRAAVNDWSREAESGDRRR